MHAATVKPSMHCHPFLIVHYFAAIKYRNVSFCDAAVYACELHGWTDGLWQGKNLQATYQQLQRGCGGRPRGCPSQPCQPGQRPHQRPWCRCHRPHGQTVRWRIHPDRSRQWPHRCPPSRHHTPVMTILNAQHIATFTQQAWRANRHVSTRIGAHTGADEMRDVKVRRTPAHWTHSPA